ncbi:MAG TPA: 3-oxoacyl-[acyl-carrier-protein] synthase III C-terminal domain-containing protein [Candidatus Polarisedimenticolia bacterium]|jgi:alkylresorcinol/alkylpyrone synthase|nr:3-oxoacyl-[acyl-carrier-protein] synthase III C-terminal domain-containing protein [Candidatus Polarisedimenticolia bacterium]
MVTPRLRSLATAVPRHRYEQTEVRDVSHLLFDRDKADLTRLLPVFDNAGIDARYSCMPLGWYLAPHGWVERSQLFSEHAVNLLCEAAEKALDQAGLETADIDTVVAVSTTGVATPSLDALVIERLGLRRDARRLPIFGLGCAGGVTGLARAVDQARALPGSNVLYLVVELCTLTFRHGDNSKSNVIASALFGDGAAAAIISTTGSGPAFGAAGEHTWAQSLDIMGWRVQEDGLGVLFSRDIPALVRAEIRPIADAFLGSHGVSVNDLAGVVCHPGGAKVLDALEDAFSMPAGGLTVAREVLRGYGNMSAATVLFVLERTLATASAGRYLMSALGPGFSVGLQLLEAA